MTSMFSLGNAPCTTRGAALTITRLRRYFVHRNSDCCIGLSTDVGFVQLPLFVYLTFRSVAERRSNLSMLSTGKPFPTT
jgi:hypothetical protein